MDFQYLLSVVLSILWILLRELKALPFKSCTDDQYKRILHNGSSVCVDCLRCPMGLGPSVECGSTVSAETKIECNICRAGVSFSPFNDFEQCQSCSVCSEDQVSKPCTPDSDTVCEKRCISKGRYYEKTSDDCQDCTWCCGDGKDIVINECLQKGMPAQKSCTVHRKKLCKPPPTPSARPMTALPTTSTLPPTTIDSTRHKITSEKEPTRSARKRSNNNNTSQKYRKSSSSVKSAPTTEWQVLIGVCVGLGVLSAAALVCLLIIYRKKCGISSEKSQENILIYTIKEEDDRIIASYKDSRLFKLLDDNPRLKEVICDKLDLNKSYAKLARHCKIEDDKVKKVEQNPGREPTGEIFDLIRSRQPGFTMGNFAKILKEIQNNEVLELCAKELRKLQPSKEIHVTLN